MNGSILLGRNSSDGIRNKAETPELPWKPWESKRTNSAQEQGLSLIVSGLMNGYQNLEYLVFGVMDFIN